MKYRLSHRADRDIEQICDRIALDKPATAEKFDAKIHQTFQMLVEFPGAGHARADVKDKRYLFWSVGNYVIAYRIDRMGLIIARVFHGARDFRRLFR